MADRKGQRSPVLSDQQRGVMSDLLNDPGWQKLRPVEDMTSYQKAYNCPGGSSCANGKYGETEGMRRQQYDFSGEE